MGETEGMEELIEKLCHLMKAKSIDKLTLKAKESSEVLQISPKELEKLRQPKSSVESPIPSGKTTILGNLVNLAQTEGMSNRAPTLNETSRSDWILDSGASTRHR